MKIDEALKYNLRAVLAQPEEPLANSQLGMSYLYAGSLELGKKYLLTAKKLDPAHFSHPQLLLARIYMSEKNTIAAALELEEFLHITRIRPKLTACGNSWRKFAERQRARVHCTREGGAAGAVFGIIPGESGMERLTRAPALSPV